MKKLLFMPDAWEDFEYWLDHDPEIADRIRQLLKECCRDPFRGIGKPEPLKHQLTGYWSRRISREDRMVYRVDKEHLVILQLRCHY
ncbi:MAG: Txe/YoeB family addiction module toxin [Victivallales bacterium]